MSEREQRPGGSPDETRRDTGGEAEGHCETQSPPRVNLFTVSALRLHMPQGGMPPTPGKEPTLRARLKRRLGRLLDRFR